MGLFFLATLVYTNVPGEQLAIGLSIFFAFFAAVCVMCSYY